MTVLPWLVPVAIVLFILPGYGSAGGIDMSHFYPYGFGNGDTAMARNDDGSSGLLQLSSQWRLFGEQYSTLYVNTNGLISAGGYVWWFTPTSFPLSNYNRRVLAPFWADVDNRKAHLIPESNIFYREETGADLLSRASDDVRAKFPGNQFESFSATWLFIATWHRVTHYGQHNIPAPENTFQIVIITDGYYSFAIYNYGELTWTTGTASGGDATTGLGGTPAQVGFDAGDGENYLNLPGSQTAAILEIAGQSHMYRIDPFEIADSACNEDGPPEVRMTFGGGGNQMQGNAEIRFGNQWYSICSTGWDDAAATVFCNQAGYPGPARAVKDAYFIEKDLPFYMTRVRCEGTETCFLDCEYSTNLGDCARGNEAGVICNNAPVNRGVLRLVGSQNEGEGNVEVAIQDIGQGDTRFQKVCDDGWGDEEANIVCKEKGFPLGGRATRKGFFRPSPNLEFRDERVVCKGLEETIFGCYRHKEDTTDCEDGEEAGVVCYGVQHAIRLHGGSSPLEGNVEILLGRNYHRVCDRLWTDREAQVACNQLGYRGPAQALTGSPFGARNRLQWLTFQCEGDEEYEDLGDCLRILSAHDCNGLAAGVRCSEEETPQK